MPLADYCGTAAGYAQGKMDVPFAWEKGAVLDVPVLSDSPVSFELEVEKLLPMDENDDVVLLCKMKNVLMDASLLAEGETAEEKLRRIAPVHTTCNTYFGWDGRAMGAWHEPGKSLKG